MSRHVRRRIAAAGTPAGVKVTLKISAADAAGGSITETILRAYRISAAPSPAATGAGSQVLAAGPRPVPASGFRPACPATRPGFERCFALFRPQTAVNRAIAAGLTGRAAQPTGWSAKAIESAYRLPVSRRSHQTVAVSIAYHTPDLAQYLAVYRRFSAPIPGYLYAHARSVFDVTSGNNVILGGPGRPAATTTCASPRRDTTRPPASALPTAPAPSE